MKRELTYNNLWLIQRDLSSLAKSHPGIFFLQENRITKFYRDNKTELARLHKTIFDIQKKYIVHDERDRPLKEDPAAGEAGKWKYLESVLGKNAELFTGDMVEQAYLNEVDIFLNRTIKVEL